MWWPLPSSLHLNLSFLKHLYFPWHLAPVWLLFIVCFYFMFLFYSVLFICLLMCSTLVFCATEVKLTSLTSLLHQCPLTLRFFCDQCHTNNWQEPPATRHWRIDANINIVKTNGCTGIRSIPAQNRTETLSLSSKFRMQIIQLHYYWPSIYLVSDWHQNLQYRTHLSTTADTTTTLPLPWKSLRVCSC